MATYEEHYTAATAAVEANPPAGLDLNNPVNKRGVVKAVARSAFMKEHGRHPTREEMNDPLPGQ